MDEPRDHRSDESQVAPSRPVAVSRRPRREGDYFAAPLGSVEERAPAVHERRPSDQSSKLTRTCRASTAQLRGPDAEGRCAERHRDHPVPSDPGRRLAQRRSERLAEVELNARIPWDVEISGGASRLVADLRGLRLGSLKVDGGASRLEVVLPAPSGTVAVVILGGASNVAIRRPERGRRAAPRSGGATNLTVRRQAHRCRRRRAGPAELGTTTGPQTATTSPSRAAPTT